MSVAYIAIGSNLGDRANHLREARRQLDQSPDTRVVAASGVYETAPVGPVEQGAFYNAVLRIETQLQPHELLDRLLAIEAQGGRVRRQRWGPRTVDLDILIYDDWRLKDDALTLPHPRLAERAFVLRPLCDLAPELKPPGLDQPVRALLSRLDQSDIRRVELGQW